jgi:magnesium-protoporphyrin IX monomethyl ester (oxidative) cyclase
MSEVCLVQMPYGALERPSIALGLLKAYLGAEGISSRVLYANFQFAETTGFDVYNALQETPAESLVGEWTFAGAAFRETDADAEAFFDLVGPRLEGQLWFRILRRIHGSLDWRRLLCAVREQAGGFVDEVAREVLASGPRIVGCTSMFQQHCGSLALLRRIKELAPDVVTMLGGANCEGTMGEVAHREFGWVDYVASGEVDAYFGGLCRRILEEGTGVRELPYGVFGPGHRGRRRLGGDAPRAVLSRLDEAAVPDYDDYFEALRRSSFAAHIKPSLLFESSRGCWWGMKHHCTFCGLSDVGMVYRSKSAPRVLDEVAHLRERYRVRHLHAVDNIIDVKHVQDVLPAWAALPEPPYLFYEVKANLRREQVRLLSAAGVRRIQPGIESLHDEVLKLLRKGNAWYINVQLLKWAREFGIEVSWNFLWGAPGESPDWYWELAEWLPLVFHLEPPLEPLSRICYDRYSPYFLSPGPYGLDLVPSAAYSHVYSLAPGTLGDFAYFFEDRARLVPSDKPRGHAALAARIEEWQRTFAGLDGPPARLTARDGGDHVRVRDTRPAAVRDEIVLEDLDYRVWKACDAAQTFPALVHALRQGADGPPSDEDVRDSLEKLKQLKLALEWRGRVLSLTVAEPALPCLGPDDRPGISELAKLLREGGPRSLARQCLAPPGGTLVEELFVGA